MFERKALFAVAAIVLAAVSMTLSVVIASSHPTKKPPTPTQAPKYTNQFPLSVTGTVTYSKDRTIWVETPIGHNVYEYNKCDNSPDLLAQNEGGTLNFTFDGDQGCYFEQSGTHDSSLDTNND